MHPKKIMPCTLRNKILRNICTYLLLLSITFSASYQQQRFYSIDSPLSTNDSLSYVEMAKGNYDVSPIHNKRFIIPSMVRMVRPLLLPIHDKFVENVDNMNSKQKADSSYAFTFWIINSIIIAGSGYLLYIWLKNLQFITTYAFIGAIFFTTSRASIYLSGTPMIDSLYLFAIALFCFSITNKNPLIYIISCILCAASKENAVLIPFLPLICGSSYRKGIHFYSALASITTFIAIRQYASTIYITSEHSLESQTISDIFLEWSAKIPLHLNYLASPIGIHNLIHGFGLISVIALIGYAINRRKKLIILPLPVTYIIPLSLYFALLSGGIGRMFFGSYMPIIAYSLIGLNMLLANSDEDACIQQ